MKHLKLKTKLFRRAALTMLLAVVGITDASADFWMGNSQICVNVNDLEWYTAGEFNSLNLGTFALENYSLILTGKSELWEDSKNWEGGGDFYMCYKIDNGEVHDTRLVWTEYYNNNNLYESNEDNMIDLAGLSAGTHDLHVWFKVKYNNEWQYDSNNGEDYVAKFTIAPTAKKALGGNLWSTFYCSNQGYKIDDDVDACAYTAKVTNSTVTLLKLGKVIPQNNAVIIVGDNPSQDETASIGITAIENNVNVDYPEALTNNNLKGVDVSTTKSTLLSSYSDATNIYVLAEHDSEFGFYPIGNRVVPARKAFLAVDDSNWGGNASTRGFSITFEDDNTTSVVS